MRGFEHTLIRWYPPLYQQRACPDMRGLKLADKAVRLAAIGEQLAPTRGD